MSDTIALSRAITVEILDLIDHWASHRHDLRSELAAALAAPQLVQGPDDSDINQVHSGNAQVSYPTIRFAQPVQSLPDHSEISRELRYVAQWAEYHLGKAKIINEAADVLEGAKP